MTGRHFLHVFQRGAISGRERGPVTGEHGIGLAKKRWWPLAVSKDVRDLHHAVKHALDPKGILNPGKFV